MQGTQNHLQSILIERVQANVVSLFSTIALVSLGQWYEKTLLDLKRP